MLEVNKIYNEDCLEGMKRIEDNSVDMILCDLPYGITACKWDVVIPFEPLWEQYERVIKDNGAIVLFGQEPFSSYLRMSNIKNYKYDWIWHKNRPSGMANAKYKPMTNHEIISVFCKNKTKYNPILEERDLKSQYARLKEKPFSRTHYGSNTQGNMGKQTKEYSCLRNPTTVKKFDVVSNHKGRLHPTQKPVALCEYLIKTYTNENEVVLDNCAGSFTTAVACDNTNRNWICIEKEEEYCNIGLTRINDNRERLSLPLLNSITTQL